MCERDQYGAPFVPVLQLREFAKSLFNYLYYHYGMTPALSLPSPHFNKMIGRAVRCVEEKTRDFNFKIIRYCTPHITKTALCIAANSHYTSVFYRNLYYITAFILDIVYWNFKETGVTDYELGPELWKMMFRNYFEYSFADENEWKGFSEAAITIMEHANDKDYLLPSSYTAMMTAMTNLYPRYSRQKADISVEEVMEDVTASLGKVSFTQMEVDEAVQKADESEMEAEDSQAGLAAASSNPPVSEIKDQSVKKSQRKRRHDASSSDSDRELYSPSCSKSKMDRRESLV